MGRHEFCHKADRHQLSAEEQRRQTVEQERPIVQWRQMPAGIQLSNDPINCQVTKSGHAEKRKQESGRSQQMLWPLAETGEKLHRQKVQESFDKSSDPILRTPEFSWPMIDDDFSYAKSTRRCQHRHKPVQFAIQPHLVKNLAAISLHPAVVIVQPYASHPPDQPVEHPRRQHLMPWVMP